MADGVERKREVGRGERVVAGVWRLRLPLPWPGIPHCNAWAVAAGDGVVLFDTGWHGPGSLAHLERALDQVNLRLEHVRLLVCTHAHSDHYGQAAPILARAACELWMHPAHGHMTDRASDPEAALARRLEVARQSGVPEAPLREWAQQRRDDSPGIAEIVLPDRELREGDRVDSDLGPWSVYETPGHAPSHVCLFQPDRRLLISGDHLLGRVSLFYDYGFTADPVAEFRGSLDRVDRLDARLCLAGHGRPFTDVRAHVRANQALVRKRLQATSAALADGARTALEITPEIHEGQLTMANAPWWLTETLSYLTHLERDGRARRIAGEPERWEAITP